MSDTQVAIFRRSARTRAAKNFKLVRNFMNRKNYVTHFSNLNFYFCHGLRLAKIHRVIKFGPEHWMEPYIAMNTSIRAVAKIDTEKDFHKLMNRAV